MTPFSVEARNYSMCSIHFSLRDKNDDPYNACYMHNVPQHSSFNHHTKLLGFLLRTFLIFLISDFEYIPNCTSYMPRALHISMLK